MALNELIDKYEKRLENLRINGHDDCYDCCDYTALGENKACLEEFIRDLKEMIKELP